MYTCCGEIKWRVKRAKVLWPISCWAPRVVVVTGATFAFRQRHFRDDLHRPGRTNNLWTASRLSAVEIYVGIICRPLAVRDTKPGSFTVRFSTVSGHAFSYQRVAARPFTSPKKTQIRTTIPRTLDTLLTNKLTISKVCSKATKIITNTPKASITKKRSTPKLSCAYQFQFKNQYQK